MIDLERDLYYTVSTYEIPRSFIRRVEVIIRDKSQSKSMLNFYMRVFKELEPSGPSDIVAQFEALDKMLNLKRFVYAVLDEAKLSNKHKELNISGLILDNFAEWFHNRASLDSVLEVRCLIAPKEFVGDRDDFSEFDDNKVVRNY